MSQPPGPYGSGDFPPPTPEQKVFAPPPRAPLGYESNAAGFGSWSVGSPVPVRRRRGKVPLALGLVFLLAAIAVGVFAVRGVLPVINALESNVDHPVPGQFQENIDEVGNYTIVFKQSTVDVGLENVTIEDPSGNPVATEQLSDNVDVTVDRGDGETYLGEVSFDAEVTGTYTFDVDTTSPTDAVVIPSLTQSFILAAVLGLGAMVLGLFGLVLAVVGVVLMVKSRP